MCDVVNFCFSTKPSLVVLGLKLHRTQYTPINWTVHLTLLQPTSLCDIWGFGKCWPLMLEAHWRIQINAWPTDRFNHSAWSQERRTGHHSVAITANIQRKQHKCQMFCSLQILAQLPVFICANARAWDWARGLFAWFISVLEKISTIILLIKTMLIND